MAILNYTTTIETSKTIAEIQKILAQHKAKAILTEFRNEEVSALSFKIDTLQGEIGIRLPANIDAVYEILVMQKKKNSKIKATKEQAARVAWRILKDWIEAQMAILDTKMVKMEEVFLPYIVNKNGETLYQVFEQNKLILEQSEMLETNTNIIRKRV